jgi:hypothetical protein
MKTPQVDALPGMTPLGIKTPPVRAGSVVMLRAGFGANPESQETVTGWHNDIKNGRAGIDYDNGHRWAYADQIVSVITY